MPIYSIIIPVYNVEQYLHQCVDSVLAQDTASTYEIILVDDGSPDDCGTVCDAYASKYEKIQAIHQKNKGLSGARNTGLAAARGTYVLFLDGDDLWEKDLLSTMDEYVEKHPDMVLFCYKKFNEEGSLCVVRPPVFPEGEQGGVYLRRVFEVGNTPFWAAWTYLYRRDFLLIHGFQFKEGLQYTEDMDFNLTCLPAAEQVYGTNRVLYLYRDRANGISQTTSTKGYLIRLEYDAKWFNIYPVTALANYYALEGLSIATVQDRDDQKMLKEAYFRNAHILSHTTGKARFAYLLLRLFGIYAGRAIFLACVAIKHFLHLKDIIIEAQLEGEIM